MQELDPVEVYSVTWQAATADGDHSEARLVKALADAGHPPDSDAGEAVLSVFVPCGETASRPRLWRKP